jgi:hypothetical protein
MAAMTGNGKEQMGETEGDYFQRGGERAKYGL